MSDSSAKYDNRPAQTDRVGNWMQTYSGNMFWPIDPRPEEVFIEDIAHALANTCRYAGHCNKFYSVAEHSVLVSLVVPPEDAFAGLMHDAPEAYVLDIPRPLKPFIQGYADIEHAVWVAITKRFNLDIELPLSVKKADNSVLMAEAKVLMKDPPAPWNVQELPADVTINCWSPERAERLFLARFYELKDAL